MLPGADKDDVAAANDGVSSELRGQTRGRDAHLTGGTLAGAADVTTVTDPEGGARLSSPVPGGGARGTGLHRPPAPTTRADRPNRGFAATRWQITTPRVLDPATLLPAMGSNPGKTVLVRTLH